MAPFISLLPVRKDKRLGAAPTQLQAPRLASPPPIEFDRFFPPSPAPPPSSKHPNLPQQDVDLSVLDFSDLLGDSRVNALEMLNDESFGFLGPDETLATVAGAQLDDESDMEEVHDELETVEEQKAPEPIVVEPTPGKWSVALLPTAQRLTLKRLISALAPQEACSQITKLARSASRCRRPSPPPAFLSPTLTSCSRPQAKYCTCTETAPRISPPPLPHPAERTPFAPSPFNRLRPPTTSRRGARGDREGHVSSFQSGRA